VSLKCDPVLAIQLRASYASITGGYHLNKRHWNTVVLDGSVPETVRNLLFFVVVRLPELGVDLLVVVVGAFLGVGEVPPVARTPPVWGQ
jgi:hypothetical protein